MVDAVQTVSGRATGASAEERHVTAESRAAVPPPHRRSIAWTRRQSAAVLVLPAMILLALAFLIPVALFLVRSVENTEITEALVKTRPLLRQWDGTGLPPDNAFAALSDDLRMARQSGEIGSLARRLNFQVPGMRETLLSTVRKLPPAGQPAGRADLVNANPIWDTHDIWALLRQESGALTSYYVLAAIGLEQNPDGGIRVTPADRTPYLRLFIRTFAISASVMGLCLLLGYPLAWGLANFKPPISSIIMIFVLVPFWMSLLVRTTGWIILLQNKGPVNNILTWLGLTDDPLPLMYSRFGVLVAMTHILLPFMVLPIYSIMKGISPFHLKAASSLGARPVRAFVHVYLPQTIPGIAAGCLLTGILALGYYITPALVGGSGDQMISYFIAFYTNQALNWGQSAALSLWLIVATLLLLWLFRNVVDFRAIKVR